MERRNSIAFLSTVVFIKPEKEVEVKWVAVKSQF